MIDPECMALTKAINSLPGLRTTESCCGHGKTPYRIWLVATELCCLPRLCWWLNRMHGGEIGWRLLVEMSEADKTHVDFIVEGPIEGPDIDAYAQADRLAAIIIQRDFPPRA